MKIVLQKRLISLFILSVFSLVVSAQSSSSIIQDSTISKKQIRQKKRQDKLDQGKVIITPFAAPGYTPELGALLAAGGLFTFKTVKLDSLIQRSSMPISVSYSTNGALVGSAILSSFWLQDKIRIYGDFWIKDMPDNYWGVGYDQNYSTQESADSTAYHRFWWWINPRIMYQFRDHFFVGLNIDYNYTKGSKASPGVAQDEYYQAYNDQPLNSGLGIIISYDSRDIPVDAWEGMLIDFRTTLYSHLLGGDNKYQVYQLDYRQYQKILRKGSTLAWQTKLRITTGDVPYGEMSQVGTPFDLRGYRWGRYRDESMFIFLAEYRYVFMKRNGKLSKHGLVGWVAGGNVFKLPAIENINNKWLPNGGIGYRLEVQPRMSLRLDFGIGRETTGFYFNFLQAF